MYITTIKRKRAKASSLQKKKKWRKHKYNTISFNGLCSPNRHITTKMYY